MAKPVLFLDPVLCSFFLAMTHPRSTFFHESAVTLHCEASPKTSAYSDCFLLLCMLSASSTYSVLKMFSSSVVCASILEVP